GDYCRIVEGVNHALDTISEKVFWYEQILDAVPFPMSVTDMNMNWTFVNRAGEKVVGASRDEVLGMHCSNWKGPICGTEDCGIECLRKGQEVTFSDREGKNLQIDVAYLKGRNGENTGHVEIVQDISSIKKVEEYQTKELNKLDQNLGKLASGRLDLDTEVSEGNEYTEETRKLFLGINESLDGCKDAIELMIEDTNGLIDAAQKGQLDTRADPTRHQGEYANIVEGMNNTLDAVIGPLNVAAEYITKIGNGEMPEKITDEYQGDFNEIKNSLNDCIDGLQGLVEARDVLQRMAFNDYTESVRGEYYGIFADVKEAIDNIQKRLLHIQDTAKNIAEGSLKDLEDYKAIGQRSENDQMVPSFIAMMESLQNLIDDGEMLANAAVNGDLNTRADTSKHMGGYADIVEGVNSTIDALVNHLDSMPAPAMIIDKDFTVRYMNRFGCDAIGLPKEKIIGTKCYQHMQTSDCNTANCACDRAMQTGSPAESETDAHPGGKTMEIYYKGVPVKNRKGEIIGALEVVQDLTEVKRNARIMEKQSEFQSAEVEKLVENLGRVAQGDLDVSIETAEGDEDTKAIADNFQEINDALDMTVRSIASLTKDAKMLANAAVEGELDTRADTSRHLGEYREIVEGVNRTLDAVIAPINEAMRVAEAYASGDLTARLSIETKGDFRRFAESLDLIGEKLTDLLVEVNSAVDTVSSTSQELASSSEEMNASTEQVSSAIQQISKGAQDQANKVDETAKTMQEMTELVDDVSNRSDIASSKSQSTNNSAVQGRETVETTIKKMEEIQKVVNESAEVISELGQRSEEIGQVVDVITNISEQTNLLALNAAIEAARAGDQGRGFAVVAEEVKNLAEDSRESAERISNMIKEVQGETNRAVDSMNRGTKETNEGMEYIRQTGKAFQDIADMASDAAEEVSAISELMGKQKEGTQRTSKAVDDIASIAEETASASEESASSTEELTASMEDLTARAQSLSEMAVNLQKLASQFKTGQEAKGQVEQKPSGGNKPPAKGKPEVPSKVREALGKRGIEVDVDE
ncbi:MAG: methyl-accepting chemotaxis protein, partial [Methanomassiliicoccales archaeon]